MVRVRREMGGEGVVLSCEEPHVEQAEWFLALLEHAVRTGGRLAEGLRIPFGWSTLTLVRREGALVVHEPDYGADPTRALREDVSTTLRVTGEMLQVARRARVREHFPHFLDTVEVHAGWQEAFRVVLERSLTEEAGASGWRIAPEGGGAPWTVRLYELLTLRPALLGVLALPRGTTALVEGSRVVAPQLAGA